MRDDNGVLEWSYRGIVAEVGTSTPVSVDGDLVLRHVLGCVSDGGGRKTTAVALAPRDDPYGDRCQPHAVVVRCVLP